MNLTDNKIFYGFDFSLLQGGVAGVIVVGQPRVRSGWAKNNPGRSTHLTEPRVLCLQN